MSLLEKAKGAIKNQAKQAVGNALGGALGGLSDVGGSADSKKLNPPKPSGGDENAEALLGEGASGALADLENPGKQIRIIFPDNIVEMDHWVNIRISRTYKFRNEAAKTKGGPKKQNDSVGYDKKDCKVSIFLPMPQQLQTGYKANFASEELGVVGSAAAGLAAGGVSTAGIREELTSGALKNIGIQASESLITTIVGGAIGGLGGAAAAEAAKAATKGALAGNGIARNPHQAMLFQGVDFRTHQFSYKFMPKTRNETNQLNLLIKAMKYHMSPGLKDDRQIFQYPELFDVDFHYPKYLFNIAASHLVDFNVDYHSEGTPAYFGPQHEDDDDDVAPVSVTLSMTFQETTITTKNEIAKGNR